MNSSAFTEPVKVIFTLPSETDFEGIKYRPLRIMPVSSNSLIGKHYSWDFILKQFRSQNQLEENKRINLQAKFASNGKIIPLNSVESYETAVKIAELHEDSFDVMIQPVIDVSSDSENDAVDNNNVRKNFKPSKLQSLKVEPQFTFAFPPFKSPFLLPKNSSETKINNSGFENKMKSVRPPWSHEMKQEIKNELKGEILDTLIAALQELKSKENAAEIKPAKVNQIDASDRKAPITEEKVVHSNIICDHCEQEIRGIRYKCSQCADFDLCETCENIKDAHAENHIFQKIRKPMQKKVYSGEDIILSLDVDLPTGRTEVKDIRFIPNQKKSSQKHKPTNFQETSSDNDSCPVNVPKQFETNTTTRDQSVRPKHIERKVAELNKKVEKLRFLGGTLISEETVADGSSIQPGTKFKKVWKVKNSGTKSWNSRTTVRFCWGNTELEPFNKVKEFSVPPLKPGQEGRITIRFAISKSCSYGFYHSHWRLHHRGQPFGQRLVCKVFVDPNDDKCAKGCNCTKCGYESKVKQKIVEFKENGANLEAALTAVREIKFCDNCEEIPIKMNVKSHTTTPTNTPFDVSPPKSPEPTSLIALPDEPLEVPEENGNSQKCENENVQKATDTDAFFENESLSAFSYSSSESSDEFVIVPLPRCFDLSTPFSCTERVEISCKPNIDLRLTLPDSGETEEQIPLVAEPNTNDPLNYGTIPVKVETSQSGVPQQNVDECLLNSPVEQNLLRDFSNDSSASADVAEVLSIEKVDETVIKPEDSSPNKPSEPTARNINTNPFLQAFMTPPQQSTENMIHVLPESIVNGALNVAANVVHNGSNENYNWVTSPPPAAIPTAHQFFETRNETGNQPEVPNATAEENGSAKSSQSRLSKAMSQLFEMGFWNQQLNEELLEKHNFDVNNAVEDLLSPHRQESFEVVSQQPRQVAPRGYTEFD
ncbi:next to BRCA1 gene 1 protein-like isoform X2 [Leptotrombidium deliense]|uniref:Next to BRCA1 gene 1 protein-like isoform X2 n=1 Tax=Leptotrombidium deliense TaxID=299467 RepID=A0A443SMD6_9ACAR|nr:next to BRCA1 gene 1 protein-like isoform X2 [Leptotrombidium deliense]